jgi:pimeloyl-ACP methyl ester carboxylesterase
LTVVDRRLHTLYPDRLGDRALMGYSMGALQSLFIAATAPTNQPSLVKFDRYVAINTPVRLLHGMTRLDEFYRAPLAWPEAERASHLENTLLKVAALSQGPPAPETALPFSAGESRFLVGLNFRFILRDIIFSSQRRNNQGILLQPLTTLRRQPVYREIMGYSYQDYFQKFALPYYQTKGLAEPVAETLEKAGDLRTYESGLRANPNVRVIVNQNDFLLADADLAWLKANFSPAQLTVFAQGGHLGNLAHPEVQKVILEALAGLQPASPKAD